MLLEWNEAKERRNVKKHGLDFSLARLLVRDPLGIVVYDRFENREHRYHLLAIVGATCLVLVHTYPDPDNEDRMRVIGLRKATAHERRHYEAGCRERGRDSRPH